MLGWAVITSLSVQIFHCDFCPINEIWQGTYMIHRAMQKPARPTWANLIQDLIRVQTPYFSRMASWGIRKPLYTSCLLKNTNAELEKNFWQIPTRIQSENYLIYTQNYQKTKNICTTPRIKKHTRRYDGYLMLLYGKHWERKRKYLETWIK